MVCNNCGKDMPAGYFRCIYCGATFYPGEPGMVKPKKKLKFIAIVIVAAITISVLVVLGFVLLCGNTTAGIII